MKSIIARSVSAMAMSRFRRPTSQSRQSVFRPSWAKAMPTFAVNDVLPVPPFPDTTAIAWPMGITSSVVLLFFFVYKEEK